MTENTEKGRAGSVGELGSKFAQHGEDAFGKIADELIGNPLVSSLLTRALEVSAKAVQAQEIAMGVLNLPSAADLERLTQRLRSVSQRLEHIEDLVVQSDQSQAASKPPARASAKKKN